MKTVAVIGLGQFGYQTAITLTQKGFEVVAIDNNVDVISEIKDLVSQAVILDSTDEKALRALHIDNVDKAVISIGSNVQSSLLSTALLQKLNIDEIYVRAISPLQENILRSMGIKHIINIEKEMGIQLSNTLSTEVGRYIEISERHSLMEIQIPKRLVGKTLQDLRIRSQFRINIVGIKTRSPEVNDDGDVEYVTKMTDVPDPKYPFTQDDMLVILGTDDNLNRFLNLGITND